MSDYFILVISFRIRDVERLLHEELDTVSIASPSRSGDRNENEIHLEGIVDIELRVATPLRLL